VDLLASIMDAAAAPLLFVCLTRTEFLDRMPERVRGSGRTRSIAMGALDAEPMNRMFDSLPGAGSIAPELRARILAAGEGNRLFLEEMVAMVVEGGASPVALPGTINALLAARVDDLPPPEQATARRASVVGRAFEESAVAALSPDDARRRITEDLLG